MVMVAEEEEEDEEAKRRLMRDRLEETFRRYEARPVEPPPRIEIRPQELPPSPRIAATRPITVERPPKMVTRLEVTPPQAITTGIPGMDSALQGGLPERSLFLVLGEPGSHHTTFTHQLLYNHALEKGKVRLLHP